MTNELYEKLIRLQWLLHKQHLRDFAEGGLLSDTARGQGRILAALKMRDGVSTKDLAYLLGLHVASLNEMLANLAKGGYVVREQSEQDKRVTLIKLTDKGRNEEQPDAPEFGDIFDSLTEEEQGMLGNLIDKVIAAVGEKLGFDEEETEWLTAASALRNKMYTEGYGPARRGLDPRGFGGFPQRPGFPHGRDGFGHGHGHGYGRRGKKEEDDSDA
jgi:DNA-binding MarR family transcriptional regulator